MNSAQSLARKVPHQTKEGAAHVPPMHGCKVLCHNLCCVIQSIYKLGKEPAFWKDKA